MEIGDRNGKNFLVNGKPNQNVNWSGRSEKIVSLMAEYLGYEK